jgi:hypothetical protein
MIKIHRPTGVPKFLIWFAVISAGLLLVLFAAASFLEEPLRRKMVQGMNQALDGYRAELEELDLHPIGLSVTIRGLTITQKAHPDPPVAVFPEMDASVHWQSLFSGRLVADWQLEEPRIHVNLEQLREENKDEVPVQKRGWQEAIKKIYPLRINLLQIHNGSFTYIEDAQDRPIELRAVMLEARNIQNVQSPQDSYPSSVYMTADIFSRGRGEIGGRADFLADPFPAVDVEFSLAEIPLEDLKPVSSHVNLIVTGGNLAAKGRIEYAPSVKATRIEHLDIDGIRIDYVHSAVTAEREKRRAEKVKEAAGEVSNKPGLLFLIERLRLTGEAGFVNEETDPDYRVFLSEAELNLSNLSNQFRRGPATADLKGKFMGSGEAVAEATFRPEDKGADFDFILQIEKARLPSMNDLLRAYGNVDVVAGTLSLYSEVSVKENRIDGYFKPLLEDVDVYDKRQEKDEGIFKKMYEGLVGGLSSILENEPREEVATRIDISGPLDDPEANTLEVILLLIRNGFFNAILPGFEREVNNLRE